MEYYLVSARPTLNIALLDGEYVLFTNWQLAHQSMKNGEYLFKIKLVGVQKAEITETRYLKNA